MDTYSTRKTQPVSTNIPTAASLNLTSRAETLLDDALLPPTHTQSSKLKRDDWMMLDSAGPSTSVLSGALGSSGTSGIPDDMGASGWAELGHSPGSDLFSDMGIERKRKLRPEVPDPEKVSSSTGSCARID